MVSFKEIGAYLDKLELEKKFDLMTKVVEDLIYPKIKVAPPPDDLQWFVCTPAVTQQAVQLTKENVDSIRSYLIGECGFFEARLNSFGLDTDYGPLKWNEWVVLTPSSAVVFYEEGDFESSFTLN